MTLEERATIDMMRIAVAAKMQRYGRLPRYDHAERRAALDELSDAVATLVAFESKCDDD